MPSIVCQRCHEVNEPNAVTCQKCGARFCPSCHLIIESPDASVCPHCGKKDLSFRPGKYAAAPASTGSSSSQFYCSNCGSKISPGARKCPYCGRLGQLVTQSPAQGFGVMQPADGGHSSGLYRGESEAPSKQKVCAKCGTPIPPGSSLCPVHGKFGGGAVMRDEKNLMPGRHTGDLWRRIEAKRAASAEAEQTRTQPRHTPPQDIYPQMNPIPSAPQDAMMQAGASQDYAGEQRLCPNCHSPVPDRSKICPSCGWNRLPMEKGRPMLKAEDYYKSHVATMPSESPLSAGQPNAAPLADQYYGQPVLQQADQYYGQPAVQPYDIAMPAPAPRIKERPRHEKRRPKPKRKGKAAYEEALEGEGEPKEKKHPLPILLALLALAGIIIVSVVMVMDQLKTPPPAKLNPSATSAGTIVARPPEISNIQFSDITQTSGVVTWQTDKKSSSIVIYCLEGGTQCENAKNDALVTDHTVSLTNLQPNKSYHITVKSRLSDADDAPDAQLDATSVLITTGVRDTTPPVISLVKAANIISSSVDASATIEWLTDEPATSQVAYGNTETYGTVQPSSTDTTMIKDHSITLNGLPLQGTIHYKVKSRDAAGNEAASPDATFQTPPASGTGVGQQAPDFTLPGTDATNIALKDLRGGKVIINFWAYNCSPCRSEMPLIQQMHEKYPTVPIIAVCGPQLGAVNKYQVGDLITTSNYTFTVALDETGQVGTDYNISSVPKTFMLDSTGIVRKIQDGSFASLSQLEALYNSY